MLQCVGSLNKSPLQTSYGRGMCTRIEESEKGPTLMISVTNQW